MKDTCIYCGEPLDTGFNCFNLKCPGPPNGISKPHTCPVCNGFWKVQKPSYVPGDQGEWLSSGVDLYPCPACKETGIVWEPV